MMIYSVMNNQTGVSAMATIRTHERRGKANLTKPFEGPVVILP